MVDEARVRTLLRRIGGDIGDLAAEVGFRNVLVHEYTVVDDARVIAALSELDDLRAFVAAIERLLAVRTAEDADHPAGDEPATRRVISDEPW